MDIGETPGGAANAFCDAVTQMSIFHLSTGSSSPPKIETASAINILGLRANPEVTSVALEKMKPLV